MSSVDLFEQRAEAAGEALRAAYLADGVAVPHAPPATRSAPGAGARATGGPGAGRRWAAPAAAALAAAAVAALLLVSGVPEREPAQVLGPAEPRETAVLRPPYLVGGGSLPEASSHAVQRFPVPFTFSTPAVEDGGRTWTYRVSEAGAVDVGLGRNGVTVLAPQGTYAPDRSWNGQRELVPAPTDGDGWGAWLQETGHVRVTERRDLLVGGAPATRFRLEPGELPAGWSGCGGGRTCVALQPMHDPQVGPARVGTGPQVGIDDRTVEMTVIELQDRAVVALAHGDPDSAEEWLPGVRALISTLRFT